MAKRKLKVGLDLETNRAVSAADKAKRSLRDVGKEGKKAGDDTSKSMDGAGKATAGFGGQLLALGGGIAVLETIRRTVTGVVDAYNRAIQSRAEFARTGAGMMAGVAGMAAQFGMREPQALNLVADIIRIGGGGDIPAVSGMVTAIASTGGIPAGAIGPGPGQAYRAAPGVVQGLGQITRFGQWAGVGTQMPALGRMISFALGGKPATRENVNRVLQQLRQAFIASGVSEWGPFLEGAVGGIMPLLKAGIPFPQALSRYAAMAGVMRDLPRAAGEQVRLTYEQLVQADRPEIVQWIGAEKYWREKKEDPGALEEKIMSRLLAPTGRERAKLYARLKIAPEIGGRLAAMRATLASRERIRSAMREADPAAMAATLSAWRGGARAIVQAGELEAAMIGAAMTRRGARLATALTIGEQEHEKMMQADPALMELRNLLVYGEPPEMEMGYQQFMLRGYRELYGEDMPLKGAGAWEPRLRGEGVTFRRSLEHAIEISMEEYMQRYPRMGAVLEPGRGGGGTTVINNIAQQFNLQPKGQGVTPDLRGETNP